MFGNDGLRRWAPLRKVTVTKVQVFRIVTKDGYGAETIFKRKRGENLPLGLKYSTPALIDEMKAMKLKDSFIYKPDAFWMKLDLKVLEAIVQVFEDHGVEW